MRNRGRVLLALLLFVFTTVEIGAATKFWTGLAGSNWSAVGNWSGGPPGPGDTASFPSGVGNRTVFVDTGGVTITSIDFAGGGYVINGNPISLTTGINTSSFESASNTIAAGLILLASQTIGSSANVGSFSRLILNGPIQLNQYTMTVSMYARGLTINGSISGTGGVTATGSGSGPSTSYVALRGNNTYTGPTTINGNYFELSGANSGTAVTASHNLYGSGSWGNTSIGGDLRIGPFATTGAKAILNTGNLLLHHTEFNIEGSVPGVDHDQIRVTGTVTLQGGATPVFGSFLPSTGHSWVLIDNDGADDSVVGSFAGFPEGQAVMVEGSELQMNYHGGDGNDVVLTCVAAGKRWTGAVDGNWNTPGNWIGGVPGTSDNAVMTDSATTKTIVVDTTPASLKSLVFAGGGFTIGGLSITSSGGISTMPPCCTGNTIDSDLVFTAPVSIGRGSDLGPGGRITINGNISMGPYTLSLPMDAAGVTINGSISGTAGVVATGVGRGVPDFVALRGSNTYTGPTSITGTYFEISANQPWSDVTASSNLYGSGTWGNTTVSGNLYIGTFGVDSSTAILKTKDLHLKHLEVDLRGPVAGTDFDQILVTGTVTLDGGLFLTLGSFIPAAGSQFMLIENDGSDLVSGTFYPYDEGETFVLDGNEFYVTYEGGDGNDVVLVCTKAAKVWTGAASSFWSNPGNWSDGAIPVATDNVVFRDSVANKTVWVDVSPSAVQSLVFVGGGFAINGNAITLAGGIVTTTPCCAANTINAGLVLGASMSFNANPGQFGGRLTINGNVALGPHTLTLPMNSSGVSINGSITGTGSVVADISGEATSYVSLGGSNSYTGPTSITGTYFEITGHQPASDVTATSNLYGGGTWGNASVNGTLYVGPLSGGRTTLRTKNLEIKHLGIDLNSPTPGTGFDQVQVTGTVTLGGSLIATRAFVPATGQKFLLIDNDGTDPVSGTFSGLAEGATVWINGVSFTISYVGESGNDVVLTTVSGTTNNAPVVATPIPDQVAFEETLFSYTFPTNTFSDPNGHPMTYSAELWHGGALPAWIGFDGATRTFSGTPPFETGGSFDVTVTATDAGNATVSDTFTITVRPPNNVPVANAQSVTTDEDVAKAITLTGSDADGDPIGFVIVTFPTKGGLTGTAPNLTYTPDANANGDDSFTFSASDGFSMSPAATVSIAITPLNDPPAANAQSVSTDEDTATAITLTGTDPDGDPLGFVLETLPAKGSLTGTAPNLTYTPNLNANGADSFTFTVNDGTGSSAPATVSITINPFNDLPVANAQSVTTDEDTAASITLTATDIENDPLGFVLVALPTKGDLTGTAPNLTYTPNLNANGPDSFTFTVNDGFGSSAPATVSITINAFNDLPVANAQSVTTDEDTAKAITLTGADVENDPLGFVLVTLPTKGDLTGTAPNLTYTPNLNANGPDSFTFTVNDGFGSSAPATISISINPFNDVPVANAQSVTTDEDIATPITLTGSDVDNDPLGFVLVTSPTKGDLTGTAPNLTYTPHLNANGPDSFTFTVNDGFGSSAPATVSIAINPFNDLPVANAQSVTTDEDTSTPITLTGSDVENDPLGFVLVALPTKGGLTGTAPNLTYTPDANANGPDSFTFTVNDGFGSSAAATVSITINAVNDPPVADALSVTTDEGFPVAVTLTGSDIDGDPLGFVIGTPPLKGSLTGTAPALTYEPNPAESGPDSFTFTVNDGTLTSAPATVSITINAAGPPSSIGGAPYLVRDIDAEGSSEPMALTAMSDGRLIFSATDAAAGREPWVSDGTASGTTRLRDIEANELDSDPSRFTNIGTLTLFTATTAISGTELWKTDGTESGTLLLKDIAPGPAWSSPFALSAAGGTALFAADDGANGVELWKSDGTEGGTSMLMNIHSTGSSAPTGFATSGATWFFAASDASLGRELWKSDGVTAALVRDIAAGAGSSNPRSLAFLRDGSTLLFFARVSGADELWKSDGTSDGTMRLTTTAFVADSVSRITADGFFAADDGTHGRELWQASAGEAHLVAETVAGPEGGVADFVLGTTGRVFFPANDGVHGNELWVSSGGVADTQMLADICPGACGSNPTEIVATGDVVYFRANNPYVGEELWTSDGTPAGTRLVADLVPGTGGSSPYAIARAGNILFFGATGAAGTELYGLCATQATKLELSVPAIVVAAAPVSVTVTARDDANRVVPCYTGTVHLTSSDGAATLPADHAFTTGEGSHAFSVTFSSTGSQTITAGDGVLTKSATVTVGASPVTSTITAAPTSIPANGEAAATITVRLRNAAGVDLTSNPSTVVLGSSRGTLSALTNHLDGTFTATLTSSSTPGTATITGTLDGVAMTSSATVVMTAPAATLGVSAPTTATAGLPVSVTVTARDGSSATGTAYRGTVHFTNAGGAAVLPPDYTFTAADAGVHVFSVTLQAVGNLTVTATDTVTSSITGSATVAVKANTTTSLGSSANPSSAGQAVTFTATVTSATAGTIAGTVTFRDGTTVLGTGTLAGGSASLSTSTLPAGSHSITAEYGGSSTFNGSASSALVQVVNAAVFGAPPLFVARATSGANVLVSWGAVEGATAYEVYRATSVSGPFNLLQSTAATSLNDATVSATTTYLYKVRAIGPAAPSPFTAADPATTVVFTDTALAGVRVKAVHVAELRTAINAMRTAAGLGVASFTGGSLAGTPILAAQIADLRTALDEARLQLGLSALEYTDRPLVSRSTPVRAAHFEQLRTGTQ